MTITGYHEMVHFRAAMPMPNRDKQGQDHVVQCVACVIVKMNDIELQAVPPHSDDRDVFIVQLHGSKHWKVHLGIGIDMGCVYAGRYISL